jgi:hypothetical protein
MGKEMALVIQARGYEYCIEMDRAIVECVDGNWNELILDRIQRQTFVSVEVKHPKFVASMPGMT